MIKIISVVATVVAVISLMVSVGHYKLKNNFHSIQLKLPEASVIEKMGKPKQVEVDFQDRDASNWIFYQYPIPTEYVLVMKDGVVIAKYYSHSP